MWLHVRRRAGWPGAGAEVVAAGPDASTSLPARAAAWAPLSQVFRCVAFSVLEISTQKIMEFSSQVKKMLLTAVNDTILLEGRKRDAEFKLSWKIKRQDKHVQIKPSFRQN